MFVELLAGIQVYKKVRRFKKRLMRRVDRIDAKVGLILEKTQGLAVSVAQYGLQGREIQDRITRIEEAVTQIVQKLPDRDLVDAGGIFSSR